MFGFAFCNEQNSGKIAFCKKQIISWPMTLNRITEIFDFVQSEFKRID